MDLPYLSYSRISTYAGCGKRYELSYVEGTPRKPQGAFLGGIAVHETIEQAEFRGWWPEPEPFEADGDATSFFRERFRHLINEAGGIAEIRWGGRKSKAYPEGHTDDWWNEFGPGMLKRYHAVRRGDLDAGLSMHPSYGVEAEVNANLPSGTRMTTRLDALVMVTPDGEAIIRDYKTGQPYPGARYQNVIYAWAVAQTLGITASYGELVYLGGATPDPIRFPITAEATAAVMTWLDAAEQGIRKEVFVPNPGPFCVSCPVLAACEVGTQVVKEKEEA